MKENQAGTRLGVRATLPRRAGALGVAVALLLSGCGGKLLESKHIDYKSATQLPPLEVPPDLAAPDTDNRFAVPDVSPSGSATYSRYRAERSGAGAAVHSGVLPQVAHVHIVQAGSERWLVVPEPPEKVWPIVKQFWQEQGFMLKIADRKDGIMETNWAENHAKLPLDFIRRTIGHALDSLYSTGELDKFRTRLERGTKAGTTEIFISHRGEKEVYTNDNPTATGDLSTRWEPRPSDPGLEAEFLTRLMERFGVNKAAAQAQLAARQPERATLASESDGTELLKVDDPFDRAWRRVGLALDRVGFTVEDRDRAKGYYYVRYVSPAADLPGAKRKSEGLLSKLAFWRSKPAPKPEQYRIWVQDKKNTSTVQVFDKDGAPDRSATAKRILSLLHEQLK